ncbi:hypothetical protein H4219_004921 [Mycoemilia scoparia]|uniref:RING-type domain-containing protein n=1 Tax=Mycoemilia scoparia TaxID=417184 RepID=A0A9W7ZPY1_9FUNG|nr:hypothetical protein H4219_004921 [Mycoemilia scoparia]
MSQNSQNLPTRNSARKIRGSSAARADTPRSSSRYSPYVRSSTPTVVSRTNTVASTSANSGGTVPNSPAHSAMDIECCGDVPGPLELESASSYTPQSTNNIQSHNDLSDNLGLSEIQAHNGDDRMEGEEEVTDSSSDNANSNSEANAPPLPNNTADTHEGVSTDTASQQHRQTTVEDDVDDVEGTSESRRRRGNTSSGPQLPSTQPRLDRVQEHRMNAQILSNSLNVDLDNRTLQLATRMAVSIAHSIRFEMINPTRNSPGPRQSESGNHDTPSGSRSILEAILGTRSSPGMQRPSADSGNATRNEADATTSTSTDTGTENNTGSSRGNTEAPQQSPEAGSGNQDNSTYILTDSETRALTQDIASFLYEVISSDDGGSNNNNNNNNDSNNSGEGAQNTAHSQFSTEERPVESASTNNESTSNNPSSSNTYQHSSPAQPSTQGQQQQQTSVSPNDDNNNSNEAQSSSFRFRFFALTREGENGSNTEREDSTESGNRGEDASANTDTANPSVASLSDFAARRTDSQPSASSAQRHPTDQRMTLPGFANMYSQQQNQGRRIPIIMVGMQADGWQDYLNSAPASGGSRRQRNNSSARNPTATPNVGSNNAASTSTFSSNDSDTHVAATGPENRESSSNSASPRFGSFFRGIGQRLSRIIPGLSSGYHQYAPGSRNRDPHNSRNSESDAGNSNNAAGNSNTAQNRSGGIFGGIASNFLSQTRQQSQQQQPQRPAPSIIVITSYLRVDNPAALYYMLSMILSNAAMGLATNSLGASPGDGAGGGFGLQYETLLMLSELIGNVKSVTVKAKEVEEALPKYKFTRKLESLEEGMIITDSISNSEALAVKDKTAVPPTKSTDDSDDITDASKNSSDEKASDTADRTNSEDGSKTRMNKSNNEKDYPDVIPLYSAEKCTICLDEFIEGADLLVPTCHHGFHNDCLTSWLTKGANSCPICKIKVIETQ